MAAWQVLMSNIQFPDLRGLQWSYTLAPQFSTEVQQATSGREVRAAFWSAPLWKISLSYEFLHDDRQHADANGYSELQQLVGFFLARQGSFDSFLLDVAQLTRKPLDSTVSGQPIGVGDGSKAAFQLVRNVGGYLEAIQNPAGQSATVYVSGVRKTQGSDYTIADGVVSFAAPPPPSAALTADFQWLWRARFAQDALEFANFSYLLWECKKLELMSIRV
jgi:uncharacterized protein (TIGR02217 family)